MQVHPRLPLLYVTTKPTFCFLTLLTEDPRGASRYACIFIAVRVYPKFQKVLRKPAKMPTRVK